MMAVLIDNEECVRMLLEAGADKEAQDNVRIIIYCTA
jgi:hypothetical protein